MLIRTGVFAVLAGYLELLQETERKHKKSVNKK